MFSKTSRSRSGSVSGQHSINRLRPYQREVALAITDSVFNNKGLTFSVEIARQGGKNELSAQLELLLLTLNMSRPHNLVKCAPTFKPQTSISMMRLKDRLNDAGFAGIWFGEASYIVRLGNARVIFLSADKSASVVGNTAHLLLEVDESQDVSREKYTKMFLLLLANLPQAPKCRSRTLERAPPMLRVSTANHPSWLCLAFYVGS